MQVYVRPLRMIFLYQEISDAKKFFPRILILKMVLKINFKIITKNHAADPEVGFLTKTISKPYGRATAMSPAWVFSNFTFSKPKRFGPLNIGLLRKQASKLASEKISKIVVHLKPEVRYFVRKLYRGLDWPILTLKRKHV